MTIAAILETLVGASALLVGVIYIVGGLIVNLHLANYGVTEYQILRVKYFVVGITFVTNAIAILFLASIPGFLILTLDFYVQQVFLIASLSASVLLLWVWAKPVESRRRFLFTWRFWILAGAVASVYPLSVAIRMMIVPQMTFESGLMLVAGFLTGILAFVGQIYVYARHLYARPNSVLGSVDPIGMGIAVTVKLAIKEEVMPALRELAIPVQGKLTVGPVKLLDETDAHYIIGLEDDQHMRAMKIAKEAVQAILYL
jgi:hypothetical protein